MFGPDPIDFFDPSPYGALAYYGHYLWGSLALIAALVALSVRKGKGLHRVAGFTFIGSCAVLLVTSISMLSKVFIPPLIMAVFTTFYAIGGAYLALQSPSRGVRLGEYALTGLELLALCLFFAAAAPAIMQGFIPVYAPFVIAIIPVILLIGDVNWYRRRDDRAKLRVARHMSRMIWAFVVVIRAPLVELAAGGFPPTFQMLYVIGPIVMGAVMLWYFQRKYGGSPFGKAA